MDGSTLIVGIIMILLIVLPVVLIARSGKKKQE